jgi:carbamoyl-phosphate synthase large subunit
LRCGPDLIRRAKQDGFSDAQLAFWWDCSQMEVRRASQRAGHRRDVQAGRYLRGGIRSVHAVLLFDVREEDETPAEDSRQKTNHDSWRWPESHWSGHRIRLLLLPAAFALEELGIESIMVNSNPETVSTDYDTSDYLFFEPLTTEDVLNICDRMQPDGVIVQFGGQTPLNLARGLEAAGVTIIGTSPDMIDAAEDRESISKDSGARLGLHQPPTGSPPTSTAPERRRIGSAIFVLVRPSYVLGGRAMEICYDQQSLERYMTEAVRCVAQGQPVLIDKFLEDAIEVDVDAISDGEMWWSSAVSWNTSKRPVSTRATRRVRIPPYSACRQPVVDEIRVATRRPGRSACRCAD